MDGIIYEISRITDEDAGEYDCHVYASSISSETRANLTVFNGKLLKYKTCSFLKMGGR